MHSVKSILCARVLLAAALGLSACGCLRKPLTSPPIHRRWEPSS